MSDEKVALNNDEIDAWREFMRAHANVLSAVDHVLSSRHSLSASDYDVLLRLSSAKESSMRMMELAQQVLLSPSGLTRRLDSLTKQGYVTREPCPADGRGLLAVLTPKGAAKVEEMSDTHSEAVREHFVNRIKDGRTDEFTDFLRTLNIAAGE